MSSWIDANNKIIFSYPIFEQIGLAVRVKDPKHAKKTTRNAAVSGARLLTFGMTSHDSMWWCSSI